MQTQGENQPFPTLKFFAARAISNDQDTKQAILANANVNADCLALISKNETWLPIYETLQLINAGLEAVNSNAFDEVKSRNKDCEKFFKNVKITMVFMFILGGINYYLKDHEQYWPIAKASVVLIVLTRFLAPKTSFLSIPLKSYFNDAPEFKTMIQAIERDLNRYAQDTNLARHIPVIREHLASFRSSWFKFSAIPALNNLRECYAKILATSEYFREPTNSQQSRLPPL